LGASAAGAMAGLVEGLLVGPLGRRRPHGRPPLWGHEGGGKGDLGGITGPLPIGRSQESGFSPCASPLPPSSSERERERYREIERDRDRGETGEEESGDGGGRTCGLSVVGRPASSPSPLRSGLRHVFTAAATLGIEAHEPGRRAPGRPWGTRGGRPYRIWSHPACRASYRPPRRRR
jgi:hypothetical protein